MSRLYDALLVAVLLIALGSFAGYQADLDVEITAAHVKEAAERKSVRPEDHVALTHPLQCPAWVMHSGTPGELARPRCYFPRSQR